MRIIVYDRQTGEYVSQLIVREVTQSLPVRCFGIVTPDFFSVFFDLATEIVDVFTRQLGHGFPRVPPFPSIP